ncbi:histone-lysine N-methyltransferase ASHR2 [Magnolia sinica]|uniref:histone-lysine N-methyltransferase ASHR2 n=1 Tax=Magnolia sinica TaxID=86752 RepID=UPI002659550B|nr:histone-lysine N-methyltransferase ASHR2 [Magnolia sinica]XP_058092787.1 histone-lysine N-methyltransferase ASHR2 [Magnolia sinica]XP_058092788.1 histone-lysine N-methyltransferase ASHR2 [Magnolia sinica]
MSETPSPFLKLAQIPGRGRSLIASRHIQPGQILLQDSPILLYPSTLSFSSPTFCSHCFRTLSSQTPSLSCPSCPNLTLFCSQSCKSSALTSSHSPSFCRTLTLIRSSSSLNPDLQTQLLFLIAAYNLASVSPSDFHRLLSLEGDPSPDPAESYILHSFLSSLSLPLQTAVGFSPELTAALLAKDKRNAFGLMEPFNGSDERSVRAYGIYPTASFFNHDCLPNACRFDYVDRVGDGNTDIVVRAIHDVEEGREICLSYFPVNWSYKDRQRRLMEDYGFVCDCDRCRVERNWKDEEEDEECMEEDGDARMDGAEEENGDEDFPHAYFFVRYLCERENCGGTLAPLPPSEGLVSNVMECNVCGQLRTEEDAGGDNGEDGVMLDE